MLAMGDTWSAVDAVSRPALAGLRCVVFDFGGTLSSDRYFSVAPPGHPNWHSVIQEHVFCRTAVVDAWMKGDLSLLEIAQIVAEHIPIPVPQIVTTMRRGCSSMTFNPAVWRFACGQRAQGRATALVTANMDVFTSTVVPAHRLDDVFDVILNTADYGELDKRILWDHAFERLGNGISFKNSLLVEDGHHAVALFRSLGGIAHQYFGDAEFEKWLESAGWVG